MNNRKQKQKPKNIPRTEADCILARSQGRDQGIKTCIYVLLYVLADKFSFSREQISSVNHWFNINIQSIMTGDIKLNEMIDLLKNEYDLELEWK